MVSETDGIWASEQLVGDAVGRLMEFWGFKRNMGRIWAVLYLAGDPLSSKDLQRRLEISAGAVSMMLNELGEWGVIKKVDVPHERREYFTAEGDFWSMISRVFYKRERVEILNAIDALEEALAFAESKAAGTKAAADKKRAQLQVQRIRQLLNLAKMGHRFIEALVRKATVDATPLLNVLLGSVRD